MDGTRYVLFAVLLAALICQSGLLAEQQTLEKSVILIKSVNQEFDNITPWKQAPMSQGFGTGFVIAGKRILTNAHNVSNCKYVEVKKQHLAKRYPAQVTFIGHDCDLAILTVLDGSFFDDTVALEFGGLPNINSTVQTYGFPVGGRDVSVTEGVVSRIQMDVYSHSQADSHLVIQTDAAINPGNSGGPVLQEGKVVGVAFQGLRAAENIGYMIPSIVVKHFLTDIEDGTYDGFGSLGFSFYPGLHSESYADYLKVPPHQEGIVVLSTMMKSSIENVLQAGDVITKIDEFDIDNDGMIKIHGLTLHMSEAIEQKQIGDKAQLTFYRNGEIKTATAQVAVNRPVLAYWREYDVPPDYVVFAGITFVPVSRNFLETWGYSFSAEIPFYLRYLFHNLEQLNTERQRKEYVVISEILPDEINSYSTSFKSKVVESVNGVDIWSLADMPEALKKNIDGYCVIKFIDTPEPLIMEYEQAAARHPVIIEKYDLPAESNLEGQI